MAKEVTGKNRTYLSINKDGYLYSRGKSIEGGFKEIELESGQKVYHKLFTSTDDGKLTYIGIRENEFDGKKVKKLEVAIEGENGVDQISMNLFRPNGSLADHVKSIASLLPNLDFSETINISPDRRKDDKGYLIRNIYINYPNRQAPNDRVALAHKYGHDIPEVDKVVGVTGETKRDTSKQDKYLYDSLLAQIERFKGFKSGAVNTSENVSTTNESAPLTSTVEVANSTSVEDDLPF